MLDIAERLGCGGGHQHGRAIGGAAGPCEPPVWLRRGADEAKREADVILALGTRLGNLDTPFDKYWGDRANQKLIQIDVDPRSLGVTRPLAIGIVV